MKKKTLESFYIEADSNPCYIVYQANLIFQSSNLASFLNFCV